MTDARVYGQGAHGVLVVDKPKGLTSHDVVARARRSLGIRRIGHVGTLDPMATGVLPLVVGRATRLASLLSTGSKEYDAVIHLGVVTDTYDATGTVQASWSSAGERAAAVTLEAVERASRAFVGTFSQQPPPYSAKKVGGVRAYRLARRRQAVEVPPATVTVYDLKLEGLEHDRLRCRVTCSPGFYMRSLAHDLGQRLGCGGCLDALRRERSGPFRLTDAVSIDALEDAGPERGLQVISIDDLLPELPSAIVGERGATLVAHGNALPPTEIDRTIESKGDHRHDPHAEAPSTRGVLPRLKVYDRRHALLAIAERDARGVLHPRIVLV